MLRCGGEWLRLAAVASGCGLIMCAASTEAWAAEWYLENQLGQLLRYEENIGLEGGGTGEQESGLASTSSIGITAGGRTPTLDVQLASLFNFTYFPYNSDLNSNDQYFTLSGKRTGERWTAALTGQYIRDTTRTSDVEQSGEFILANKRRDFFSISPTLKYSATAIDSISFSPYYYYNHYNTDEIPDSSNLGVQVAWDHDLSQRTQIMNSVSASKLNSNDNVQGNDNSRYYELLIGANHKFSENLLGSLSAGPTLAETDRVENGVGGRQSQGGTTLGYGFAANLTYSFEERLSFKGDVRRTLAPSTTAATLNEDTSVRIAANYQLFANLFVEMPVSYLHRELIGDDAQATGTSGTRDYAAVEPTLRWRIGPDWDFRIGYGLQWQKTEDGNGFGNAGFAFLTYRLPRLAMSR